MPDFTDDEYNALIKLWAEAYLRLKRMGEMLLAKQSPKKLLNAKMGIGEMELDIVKRDKNGNIVHQQKIHSTGGGKILEHKRWDKEKKESKEEWEKRMKEEGDDARDEREQYEY